jgi:hypothetical protein
MQEEINQARGTHQLKMAGGEGGLVRTQKEIDQARGTHFLEMAEGETGHDTEINQQSKWYSLPRDSRGKALSEHRKRVIK